ncbi:MAG: hypothetical protein R2799_05170 [Crocinitomicaceae bacterium]
MKRNLSILFLSFLMIVPMFAQKLEKEVTHVPESLTKDSYVGNVSYDPSTEVTSLTYVEKDMFKTKFKTYSFDKDFKFIKEDVKVYTFGDAWRDAMKELRESFQWFRFRGEEYTREWIDIRQGWGGKIVAEKKKATWKYNWFWGGYVPHYDYVEAVKIKSETDDKIYLYDHVVNTTTGDAYMIVGVKAPKGSKDKKQHARKFQIVKLTPELDVEYLEEFEYKYNMCVSFSQVIYGADADEEDDEYSLADVADGGEWYVMFAPVKGMSGKDDLNPVKGESQIIRINSEGKITGKLDFTAPTEGWVIKGMVQSPDKKDYYFFGPAKDGVYIDQVASVVSPVVLSNNEKEIKYKNYQILKVASGKVAWINSTDLEEFETKASAPPSQKKLPEYGGKNFTRRITFVTGDGELILSGQNYTKQIKKDAAGNFYTVLRYKDLILAHFDNQGKLKRAYGVRRDKMNNYSKSIITPQSMYITPNGKHLYWVYGEIAGMRAGFSFNFLGATAPVSKRKLLYYPAVAKVDLENATIGDFVFLGANAEGKQEYYTNPSVGEIMSADGKKLIFVGEDKKGKMLWLAKMAID